MMSPGRGQGHGVRIEVTVDRQRTFLSGTNEEANFHDLQTVLAQLGKVASHATTLFQELYNDTVHTCQRVEVLGKRIGGNLYGNGLPYVERQLVAEPEPLRLYDSRVEIMVSDNHPDTGNLFTSASLPSGLAERCRMKMEAGPDFESVDQLSVRQTAVGEWVDIGSEEFKPAALSISNPNFFNEQFIEGLHAKAQLERAAQRAKREKRKEGRARKKSMKGDQKARVRRVRKKRRGGLKDTIGVDEEDDAESAFRKVDTTGSGYIEFADVQRAFSNLGEEMSSDQMRDAMARMDADGDGKVRQDQS